MNAEDLNKYKCKRIIKKANTRLSLACEPVQGKSLTFHLDLIISQCVASCTSLIEQLTTCAVDLDRENSGFSV
jgi:hypothetical protein|tara:strand:+ start:1631 stop:1849 length:219 start_codon:yes stop_codon:yes gene_type:complete